MSANTTDTLINATNITRNSNDSTVNNNRVYNRVVRDVHRAGWLRYIPFAENSRTAPVDDNQFWVVFSVQNETEPYLEFFKKRQFAADCLNGPVSKQPLQGCQHISASIVVNDKTVNEFTISLDTHVIRLVAESQQSMNDWIHCLKLKLRLLKVLAKGDNHYTTDPQLLPRRNSLRSFRPLPPLPATPSLPTPATLALQTPTTPLQSIPPPPSLPLPPTPVPPIAALVATTSTASPLRPSSPTDIYEAIFDERLPQRTHSLLEPLDVPNSHIPLDEGPPPYESISSIQSTPVSLRESQVLRLRKEITHPSGVRLMVRKRDIFRAIALIDMFDSVWIAGWKQKEFPVLHNTFHIGDRLLSINGDPVANASQAYRLIKQNTLLLEIIVKRVPNGRVLCIKRKTEGQDLGLTVGGNTAEITGVANGGLADRAGLTQQASYGDEQCNWFVTEVNNRALNLFYKNNEIHDRLQAVGKEISLLVQPLVFVKKLKKQLKQFKNYKDYIVQ